MSKRTEKTNPQPLDYAPLLPSTETDPAGDSNCDKNDDKNDTTTVAFMPPKSFPDNELMFEGTEEDEQDDSTKKIQGKQPPSEHADSDKEAQPSSDDGNSGNKDKSAPVQLVSYFGLFRFASRADVLLMILGTFAAMGNGIAQPLSFIVFGELISSFIIHAKEIGFRPMNSTAPVAAVLDIEGEMTKFALYYVYIACGMLFFAYIQATFWSLASVRQTHRIRHMFFKSILRQDIGWFDTNDSGELSTRLIDDVAKIQNGIGDKIGLVIQSLTMFFAGFFIGFYYGWKLTLVILALTPAFIVTASITGKVIGTLTSKEQTAYAKAGSVAEEVISAIRTVVAFGGEKKELKRFEAKLVDAKKAGVRKGISTGAAFGMFHVVMFSCYALAFWYGSKLIVDGELTGGDLLIVFFSVMVGASRAGQCAPNVEAMASARGAAFAVFEIIDRVPAIDSMSSSGKKPERLKGNIDFIKVEFNYPSRPDVKVLDGFNLAIHSGETVALVGESGCGKSTTVKLIQRFYDAILGDILIDGEDIKELNVAWLRDHIGIVSQEPLLFDATIGENICMGKADSTQAEIESAAKDANAHNFIMNLPKGYNTLVGEGGAQLSGGQKQRVAIARALIKNPQILLLDEATSALDTESESVVQAALDKASEGRTTVIIAHRLSTVRKADKIAAVQNGRIVEIGSHDELMEKRGVYYQLVMLQTFEEEEHMKSESENEDDEEMMKAKAAVRLMSNVSVTSNRSADISRHQLQKIISREESQGVVRHMSRNDSRSQDSKAKLGKSESIIEENVEPAPISRIARMNAPEWYFMVIGSFFSAIVGAFPVVFALILSEILKTFSLQNDQKAEMKENAQFWSLMFLALGGANGISLFISSYVFAEAGERLTSRIRKQAFEALLNQDISYFDDPANSTGAITGRLASDASAIQGATKSRLSTMVQMIVMGVTSLTIAFYFSWQLTLLIFAFVPFLIFAGTIHIKMHTGFAKKEKEKITEAGAIATEAIMNIRTVASLGKESFFIIKYDELLAKPYKESLRQAHIYGISSGFSGAIMFLCNAAAFRLGGYLVAQEDDPLPFEDVFKVVFAITFGALIAGQLSSFAPDYVKAKISAARIFKLMDREPLIDTYKEGGVVLEQIEGKVEFHGVEFQYPTREDVKVLRGLDVTVSPGQTLALVGTSGCGKSTAVSLLERFYDVNGGSVTIDGYDIRQFNLSWIRSQIGIVSQEPTLFDCTIRENIAYGLSTEATQDEIEAAAKASNIHNFIMTLPKAYDTMVGDKGTLISGGQKQRIAIARALIRNPQIMLLDEATSALDSESEKIVQDALDVAKKGRTSIVIAHRLSTIQNADIIAVIQGGRIIESGTHAELLAKKGAYYVLNTAQL